MKSNPFFLMALFFALSGNANSQGPESKVENSSAKNKQDQSTQKPIVQDRKVVVEKTRNPDSSAYLGAPAIVAIPGRP